ncbi:hypothetical protein FQA39_LY13988 [Lamprigera yunnana]|nr:hypothetical protein FQA39_LY13988 [Lamprigera yunnana]
MISFEQYQLTSVIKLWIADCKSNKMKKTLLKMFYYLYYDQNSFFEFFENEIPLKSISLSHDSECDKETPIKNNLNDSRINNREHNKTAGQAKRKCTGFPYAVKNKIAYYEAKSTHAEKINPAPGSNLLEQQFVEVNTNACPPPVVVDMILKEQEASSSDARDATEATRVFLENERSFLANDERTNSNVSILSNKDRGNERFLINAMETKLLTNSGEGDKKISNSTLVPMTSTLYITDFSTESGNSTLIGSTPQSCIRSSLDAAYSEMKQKIYKQCQIIKQATKAVRTCKNSKTFLNSIQRAEAERILLTASLQCDHLLGQLQGCEYEELANTADLTISNIKFVFNVEQIGCSSRTWFLVTCATESIFHVSSMFEVTYKDSCTQIPDMFTFKNVPPDFAVRLCVYELNIAESNRVKTKRTSQRFKGKVTKQRNNRFLEEIKSSFRVCGWVDLTMDTVNRNELNLNGDVLPFTSVHFSASTFSSALNQEYSGFLTMGFQISDRLVWDRNWCKLLNSVLYFWSNPSEESLNTAKMFIDLRNCVTVNVDTFSMRSNTIILETTGVTVERYYLSCDNADEFKNWKKYVNDILGTFCNWKSLMYV